MNWVDHWVATRKECDLGPGKGKFTVQRNADGKITVDLSYAGEEKGDEILRDPDEGVCRRFCAFIARSYCWI